MHRAFWLFLYRGQSLPSRSYHYNDFSLFYLPRYLVLLLDFLDIFLLVFIIFPLTSLSKPLTLLVFQWFFGVEVLAEWKLKKINYFYFLQKFTTSYWVIGPIQFYQRRKDVCFFIYFSLNIFCYPQLVQGNKSSG